MLTKTKIALAATLLAATTSFAAAQDISLARRGGFDANMANRYPAYAEPVSTARHVAQGRSLHTAPVGLHQQNLTTRPVALPQAPAASDEWLNRASQVFDGGAG